MPLQLRLTATFLLLALPVLVLFGAGVYFVSQARLHDGVDRSLVDRAQAVHSVLVRSGGRLTAADIVQSRSGLDRLAVEGGVFEVRDLEGAVLYSSNGAGLPLAPAALESPSGHHTRDIGGESQRIYRAPLVSFGEVIGRVEVREPLALVDDALADIRGVLLAGGLVLLLATALPLLACRALDPVRRVSRLAREIERTANFSRRIDSAGTQAEMRELTETFNKMIERVEKMMQAQRAFLADSSHELRRPLTLLRTNIDVINDPGLSEADRQMVEAEMRSEAESMSRLVTNLGLLSRDGQVAFSFQVEDLASICEAAVASARLAFPERRFLADVAPGVSVRCDVERLGQVLANLLENAAVYSHDAGIISTTLRCEDGTAVLEVTDYGIGMSETDVAHAFERFYRGSSAREHRSDGYGLGLSIVRHVVEAHGGAVRLSSRPGQGTSVRIALPVAAATPADLETAQA